MVEAIWVGVREGAEKTGYHIDHMRRVARTNWHLPEAERHIRIRKNGTAYELWLPDVMRYLKNENGDDSPPALDPASVEQTWVNVTEGAEITSYNRDHLRQFVRKLWNMPESERSIQIRKRTNGFELWLPDLVAYVNEPGHGPQRKRKTAT